MNLLLHLGCRYAFHILSFQTNEFFKPHQTRSAYSSSQFFKHINTIIDWKPIEEYLVNHYKPGKKQRGQKAYHPMILFKMQLISVWYGLSDVQTENLTMDCISFCQFCGLELMDSVPDHSTLSRFRSELTRKKLYQPIMLIVKGTAIIDASLTLSPFSPKGKLDHQMAEDRKEDTRSDTEVMEEEKYHQKKEEESPHADHETRWFKNRCVTWQRLKTYFGYKRHIATNDDGLILGVHTTPANEHDSQGLGDLMEKVPVDERKEVMGVKGYNTIYTLKLLIENLMPKLFSRRINT